MWNPFRKPPPPEVKKRRPLDPVKIARLMRMAQTKSPPVRFEIPNAPMAPGMPPAAKLAMDDAISPVTGYLNSPLNYGSLGTSLGAGYGNAFPGYPRLIAMSQQAEYRMISEVLAKQMTRKGIVLSANDDDKDGGNDKERKQILKDLYDDLDAFGIESLFRNAIEHDGLYGRSQIFIDTKAGGGSVRLNKNELALELRYDSAKIGKGGLLGFRVIEPFWCYPDRYDAADPLSPDFYRPTHWHVMSQKVHASRLLFFCARPVADMLKPIYQFGGLSMTQLASPYVENWIRTRDSIGNLLHSFSNTILYTNLLASLSEASDDAEEYGTEDLGTRMGIFNRLRDNHSLLMLDMEGEKLDQVNTPLSGLHELQAQAQEHIASVSHIPLLFLLGTSPSGLNASTDGEVRAFYDWILSMQEDVLRGPYQAVLNLLQLNRYGKIDPAIKFEFAPLWQMDDQELATVRKSNADSDAVYLDRGVISPEEARTRLASDATAGYQSLDPEDLPEPPVMPGLMGGEEDTDGNDPAGAGRNASGDDS